MENKVNVENVSGFKIQKNEQAGYLWVIMPKRVLKNVNWDKGTILQAKLVTINGRKGLFYS